MPAPVQQGGLPSITRFSAGLVTNRNPLDTPFSVQGMNLIVHHDALCDGLNVEISSADTLIRRPGFTPFAPASVFSISPTSSLLPVRQAYAYKDLQGNIELLYDANGALFIENNTVGFSTGNLWSFAPQGNFLYAANGGTPLRFQSPSSPSAIAVGRSLSYTRPSSIGISPPLTQPGIQYLSSNLYIVTSDFVPTTDTVGGILTVTDNNNARTITVTINAGTAHVNVVYSKNPILPNQSYTETITTSGGGNTQTQTVTEVTGYTGSVSGNGVTNGVINYYPSTGISSLDYDVAYSGSLTMVGLSTLLNNLGNINTSYTSIPANAVNALVPFFSCTLIPGLAAGGITDFPTIAAQAIQLQPFAQTGNLVVGPLTIGSGLYDVSNPQFPIRIKPGFAPRYYRYTSTAVKITDTFSGSLTMISAIGTSVQATPLTFTSLTIGQIATQLFGAGLPGAYSINVIQQGALEFIQIAPTLNGPETLETLDRVVSFSDVAITNDNNPSQPFSFNLQSCNYASLVPKTGYKWYYAIRDVESGGLSNLSPVASLGAQAYPGAAIITIPVTNSGTATVIEVYRTTDGGSIPMFVGYAISYVGSRISSIAHTPAAMPEIISGFNSTPTSKSFSTAGHTTYEAPSSGTIYVDTISDEMLNPLLVGPLALENSPPPVGIAGLVSHSSRVWGFVNNRLYYSGGAETVNGNGNESWPPSNYFSYPGNIQSVVPTHAGLVVALSDDLYIVRGNSAANYYSSLWVGGAGITNPLAIAYEGQTVYVYTHKQELYALIPTSQRELGIELGSADTKEIGNSIGDLLLADFPAATTNLTVHRGSSRDAALYVSNGTDSVFRYSLKQGAWSPVAKPAFGAGRIVSLETTIGINTLLLASPSGSSIPGVFARSLSTFTDNGTPYNGFATIGTLQVAQPGSWATLEHIAMNARAIGTVPTVSVLNQEIVASTLAPFVTLNSPINDPPDLAQSQSLFSLRWYLKSATVPLPQVINTTQVQISFLAEAAANEILGVYLRPSK